MEILVHVSAPSSAHDDARYRAQVAAISSAFELVSVSRPLRISDDDQHYHRDGLPLVPAGLPSPPPADVDAPETAENAEPAEPADSGSSLLLRVPEPVLISAPSSVSISSLVVENASAAIEADQVNGARQTSSDSSCDRDLKDLDLDWRRKNLLGNPPLPHAEEGCPESTPAGIGTATTTVTATTIANSNPNLNPCPRRVDRQSIPPSPNPGTNQSRPNPLAPAPDQTRESEYQIAAINAQPQIAPDSLGSLISVIPDSQPEVTVSGYAQQSCQSATRPAAQLHEEDDHDQPSRAPKRRRVEPCSPRPLPQTGQGQGQGQTIGKLAASESTVTVTLPLDSAHHVEKALSCSRDESESPPSPAPEAQGAYPHLHTHSDISPLPFPTHPPNSNPVSADSHPVVSVTENRHHPQEEQHQHQDPHDTILSTFPLSLRPAPPPISASTFTTHITPTLAMLTQRLKPARTYKPTHQVRDLDKLERGYWAMRIDIVPKAAESEPAPAQTHEQEKSSTKDVPASGSGSDLPQTWTETQFTHFWTFLSDFIAKEARAGWGVWCIVDHVEAQPQPQAHLPNTHTHTNARIAGETHIPVQLKVYAWGEVAMHIYLMLYLASERRVRGMGLRWVDSWEEVVIQMP